MDIIASTCLSTSADVVADRHPAIENNLLRPIGRTGSTEPNARHATAAALQQLLMNEHAVRIEDEEKLATTGRAQLDEQGQPFLTRG